MVGQQSRHDFVAQRLQASDGVVRVTRVEASGTDLGEDLPQLSQTLVGVPGGGFEESVGAQHEETLVGQAQLVTVEGEVAAPSGGSGITSGPWVVPLAWTTTGGGCPANE